MEAVLQISATKTTMNQMNGISVEGLGMTTKAKEKPILFSGPMVRAILDGRKTQTRRVVTVRNSCRQAAPQRWFYDLSRAWRDPGFPQLQGGLKAEYLHVPFCNPEDGWEKKPIDDTVERWYSLWQPGDRLWVRETWAETDDEFGCPIIAWKAGGSRIIAADGDRRQGTWRQWLIHDSTTGRYEVDCWRPSIHMPRWASRILLEVTNVRAERVQDINERDAKAEGAMKQLCHDASLPDSMRFRHRNGFINLWDSLNAKRGFGWKENPWVWVVEFRRITP